ncbi:hypothetical protein NL676_009572 [Syzygium grande]|nr:hypothetical protein NL676_009572 [Syzygium grande]
MSDNGGVPITPMMEPWLRAPRFPDLDLELNTTFHRNPSCCPATSTSYCCNNRLEQHREDKPIYAPSKCLPKPQKYSSRSGYSVAASDVLADGTVASCYGDEWSSSAMDAQQWSAWLWMEESFVFCFVKCARQVEWSDLMPVRATRSACMFATRIAAMLGLVVLAYGFGH